MSKIFGRPGVELVEIDVLQRVLELRLGETSADRHVLRGKQVGSQPPDLRELGPEPRNHLEYADVALFLGLEGDEHAAHVLPRAADAGPEPHPDRLDRGVGLDNLSGLFLQPVHFGKRGVLRRLGRPVKNAGVLLREEAFGMVDEQIDSRERRWRRTS